ncbi:hypothetical protein [Rhodococcus ruber]|uniref:hypothetical protein n=1 Tax=Rhodococcus ruber TaxID=1830 RepID=UPI0018755181|nr:hypothetical protein [Rhodococcus ruber]
MTSVREPGTGTPRTGTPRTTDSKLFGSVLDMARAAKRGDVSGWLTAKSSTHRPEDVAYLSSVLLGVLIENDAVRRGIHPADVWRELRERGLDDFG